jgi:hypothetical protein
MPAILVISNAFLSRNNNPWWKFTNLETVSEMLRLSKLQAVLPSLPSPPLESFGRNSHHHHCKMFDGRCLRECQSDTKTCSCYRSF